MDENMDIMQWCSWGEADARAHMGMVIIIMGVAN